MRFQSIILPEFGCKCGVILKDRLKHRVIWVKSLVFSPFFLIDMTWNWVLIFTSFPIYLGSWWLFPKVGFAGLTARDYLGKLSLFILIIFHVCLFIIFMFVKWSPFFTLTSAIGTIFSSTDTVCTLQVSFMFSQVWFCKNFTMIHTSLF